MSAAPTILLADDDQAIRTVLEQAMKRQGFNVLSTDDGTKLMQWVDAGKGDVVITDVLMPSANGLELLPRIKEKRPTLPVIIISAQNTLMTAVKANELGAYDYLAKPFDLNELIGCVGKSLTRQATTEAAPLSGDIGDDLSLVGTSPAMQDIYRILARLVAIDLTVLITGESGTGKELFARALHNLGRRKGQPFVAINMAAIPRELVESELFGHEKGSFTGAANRKTGKFEQAEGGTLFLDEIGDMPLDAQTKLLRVLQQGEYTTVGGGKAIKTNLRIVCATHRDLSQLVQSGQFREDLYYRLNVVPLRIPPLRERREDVGTLAQYFLHKAQERGLPQKTLETGAIEALQSYNWPGNVRELENLIYRLAALYAEHSIGAAAVHTELAAAGGETSNLSGNCSLEDSVRQHLTHYFAAHTTSTPSPGLYDRVLELVERPLIELTLESTNGNQVKAAQILGINRNTLRKKISDLGIAGKDEDDAA